MKPAVLLFGFSKADSTKLMRTLLPAKIRLKKIKVEDYARPLGELAGMESISLEKSSPEKELSHPMIVFAGFTSGQLDFILNAIRRSGVGPIPYKAVLTPTNQSWDAFSLLEELKQEHEKMQG